MMAESTPQVRPGQVWADNDPRSNGRMLLVNSIEGEGDDRKAVCEVIALSREAQESIARGESGYQDTRGKVTRVAVRRFVPTSTGYRLVSQPDGGIDEH